MCLLRLLYPFQELTITIYLGCTHNKLGRGDSIPTETHSAYVYGQPCHCIAPHGIK